MTNLLLLFQFYVSPKLAMIALGIVPPIAAMSIIYGRYVRKITKKVQDSLAEATQVTLLEYLQVEHANMGDSLRTFYISTLK